MAGTPPHQILTPTPTRPLLLSRSKTSNTSPVQLDSTPSHHRCPSDTGHGQGRTPLHLDAPGSISNGQMPSEITTEVISDTCLSWWTWADISGTYTDYRWQRHVRGTRAWRGWRGGKRQPTCVRPILTLTQCGCRECVVMQPSDSRIKHVSVIYLYCEPNIIINSCIIAVGIGRPRVVQTRSSQVTG